MNCEIAKETFQNTKTDRNLSLYFTWAQMKGWLLFDLLELYDNCKTLTFTIHSVITLYLDS